MNNIKQLLFSLTVTALIFSGCGTIVEDSDKTDRIIIDDDSNPKYSQNQEGLIIYAQDLSPSSYKLEQLDNNDFNKLNDEQKLQVADKLLSTLFFGYPLKTLEDKIDSGNFITDIQSSLKSVKNDTVELENYISNKEKFDTRSGVTKILTRFYAMKELDSLFLKNWTAYILSQTIMFSPAVELDSAQEPNIDRVYNRLVKSLAEENTMQYMTYIHMMSDDNWRRFRSPEDNGREMLEIFLLDMDDTHVPIAAKALQNWRLDKASYTLVVGLDDNAKPLELFGTTIYNGEDFYRELAKSDQFTKGATTRLVDFFFTDTDADKKGEIIDSIVSSTPKTWQDILIQIIFSKEYLINTSRAKSAEEAFFSLTKKMDYKHRSSTFYNLKNALNLMNQASMKYKLGKLNRVPLDTLSFAYYHKFIRDSMLRDKSNPEYLDDYTTWRRDGWSDSFIDYKNFNYDTNNAIASLNSLIDFIFKTTISRAPTTEELLLFQEHMIRDSNGKKVFHYAFDMFRTYEDDAQKQKETRASYKANIAILILDYISRLDTIYMQERVK